MFVTGKSIYTIDIKFAAFWNLEYLKKESIFSGIFLFSKNLLFLFYVNGRKKRLKNFLRKDSFILIYICGEEIKPGFI